jgi:hypothetical protein
MADQSDCHKHSLFNVIAINYFLINHREQSVNKIIAPQKNPNKSVYEKWNGQHLGTYTSYYRDFKPGR